MQKKKMEVFAHTICIGCKRNLRQKAIATGPVMAGHAQSAGQNEIFITPPFCMT